MTRQALAYGRAFSALLAVSLSGPILASERGAVAEVEARVAAFAEAFRDADAATLEAMLTPRYVHTNAGDAPLAREQWLSYVGSRKQELVSGQLRLSRYENQDVEVVLYGATAVVTGINHSEGVRQGSAFSRSLRFTQVWVKRDGSWLRAAFQDAEASP